MNLIELKFKDERDYHRAAVIHGTILEERGWKPDPSTSTTMVIGDADRAMELKRRLTVEGIEFQDVNADI